MDSLKRNRSVALATDNEKSYMALSKRIFKHKSKVLKVTCSNHLNEIVKNTANWDSYTLKASSMLCDNPDCWSIGNMDRVFKEKFNWGYKLVSFCGAVRYHICSTDWDNMTSATEAMEHAAEEPGVTYWAKSRLGDNDLLCHCGECGGMHLYSFLERGVT